MYNTDDFWHYIPYYWQHIFKYSPLYIWQYYIDINHHTFFLKNRRLTLKSTTYPIHYTHFNPWINNIQAIAPPIPPIPPHRQPFPPAVLTHVLCLPPERPATIGVARWRLTPTTSGGGQHALPGVDIGQ